MQTLEAVDDHMHKYLRTYSLDCVKVSTAVPLSTGLVPFTERVL